MIASYLLKGLPEVARIQYSYYEGSWNQMPDFSKLKPVITASTDRIDVSLRKKNDQFGFRFEGFLKIETPGDYTFHLGSDDGSTLKIDGKMVVDHGAIHGYSVKSGGTRLEKGYRAVVIDYFEQAGEERITAEFEGPEVKRQALAGALSFVKDVPEFEDLRLAIDSDLVAKGRQLFASVGCAACHQIKEDGENVSSNLTAVDLAAAKASKGCLAKQPSGNAPRYSLTTTQRQALNAVLSSEKEKDAAGVVHATLVSLNCYACHERNKTGGISADHNPLFVTTVPEMGDEGRIPPRLTGVGAKLTRKWMEGVFADGANDRPYMLTRMPRFGAANLNHLQPLMARLDKLEGLPEIDFADSASVVKRHGRRTVGPKGLPPLQ